MELTKAYFDQQLKRFGQTIGRQFDGMATKDGLKSFVTKKDAGELKNYVNEIGSAIIEAINKRFDDFTERLDGFEKRLDGFDIRLNALDKRFVDLDKRFDGLDSRLTVLEEKVDNLTVAMAFTATKQDIRDIKDRLDEIDKRDVQDSNLFNQRLVQHDKQFAKLYKEIYRIKIKINPKLKIQPA